VCCSVLQCVAVCCSVLQYVAVCCSVLQCVVMRCSVLLCVAMCCSVLQCVAVWSIACGLSRVMRLTTNDSWITLQHTVIHCNKRWSILLWTIDIMSHDYECCSMCVAVCCSVHYEARVCVAVWCSVVWCFLDHTAPGQLHD